MIKTMCTLRNYYITNLFILIMDTILLVIYILFNVEASVLNNFIVIL